MKKTKKSTVILFLLSLLIAVLPIIACDSLNPGGSNTTVIETDDSTTYIYPDNDQMKSCSYYKDGGYSCEVRK